VVGKDKASVFKNTKNDISMPNNALKPNKYGKYPSWSCNMRSRSDPNELANEMLQYFREFIEHRNGNLDILKGEDWSFLRGKHRSLMDKLFGVFERQEGFYYGLSSDIQNIIEQGIFDLNGCARVEHGIPGAEIARILLTQINNNQINDKKSLIDFLKNHYPVCLVTLEEDQRITNAGYFSTMPQNWTINNDWVIRYELADIELKSHPGKHCYEKKIGTGLETKRMQNDQYRKRQDQNLQNILAADNNTWRVHHLAKSGDFTIQFISDGLNEIYENLNYAHEENRRITAPFMLEYKYKMKYPCQITISENEQGIINFLNDKLEGAIHNNVMIVPRDNYQQFKLQSTQQDADHWQDVINFFDAAESLLIEWYNSRLV
jgi:hypothetical protein